MEVIQIEFGGKTAIIKGCNLQSALENYGFKGLTIEPQWRGRSNGKYIAFSSDRTFQVRCMWLRKQLTLNISDEAKNHIRKLLHEHINIT